MNLERIQKLFAGAVDSNSPKYVHTLAPDDVIFTDPVDDSGNTGEDPEYRERHRHTARRVIQIARKRGALPKRFQ